VSEIKYRLAGAIGSGLMDGLLGSLKYHVEGAEQHEQYTKHGSPVIFAIWHGRLLAPCYLHRRQGVVALISRSADGEYLARLLSHWGYETVRGSSSRGGSEALRELVRYLRKGRSLAITPDGPRGPMQRLKPGVLTAAQLGGVPIIPTTASTKRGWWPGKWDRFLIPKPFAKVWVRYEKPVVITRTANETELEQHRQSLEDTLNRMTAELDRAIGHEPV
jgi:lysophospholipid acyltransferase (LPLAT)-like uncharacterized protein